MEQGDADGAVGVLDRLDRLGRVDHPAPLGQRLEREALAVPEQRGGRGLVHLEDESGSAAHRVCPFLRSNAILTAPRRPAAPAWATASSTRVSGYVADTSRPVPSAPARSSARENVETPSAAPAAPAAPVPRSVP